MRHRRIAVFALILTAAAGWSGAQPPAPDSVVARFENKSVRTPVRYRAKRRLEAANARYRLSGWIEVVTELESRQLRYAITRRGGSELIQNKVLIASLAAEQQLLKEGREAVVLSSDNYRLEAAGPDARGFERIRLTPRRRDKRLIDGYAFLTPDADLVEVSGRLAKAPSFWTTAVTFTRRYGKIGDVRVPISVTSVADVRFAGRSTFSMTYQFETIDGADVREAVSR